MAEELKNQMGERLPGSMQAAAKAAHHMGITSEASTQALFEAMENGRLAADEFLPVLAEFLMEAAENGGALEKAMKSTSASLGRLRTELTLANKTFAEAGFDRAVADVFDTLSDSVREAEPLWAILGQTTKFLGAAIEGPIEMFGELASRMGVATEEGYEMHGWMKSLLATIALRFRPFRRLVAGFGLLTLFIPAITDTLKEGFDGWDDFFTKMAIWAVGVGMMASALGRMAGGLGKIGGAARNARDSMFGGRGQSSTTSSATSGQSSSSSQGRPRIPLKGAGKFALVTAMVEGFRQLISGEPIISGDGWSVSGPDVVGMFDQRNMLPPMLGPNGGIQQGQLPFGPVNVERVEITIPDTKDPEENARQAYLIFNEEVRRAAVNEQTTEK